MKKVVSMQRQRVCEANSVTPIVPASTDITSRAHVSEQSINVDGIATPKYSYHPLKDSLPIGYIEFFTYLEQLTYIIT